MPESAPTMGEKRILERQDFQTLFDALSKRGYKVLGPTLRDGAIVYDEIASVADLPTGWTDQQDGGTYRLALRDDGALLGYAVGPHCWERFLFPYIVCLLQCQRTDGW